MKVKVETDNEEFEVDVKHFSTNNQLRAIALHHYNGTVEIINMDFIRRFTVPEQALAGVEVPVY